MPDSPELGKIYRSLWPLPGGQGTFFATLLEVLTHVEQHNGITQSDFFDWLGKRYHLGAGAKTLVGYTQVITRMGYLTSNRTDRISLTGRGKSLLNTKDVELVLSALMNECLGFYEVLAEVSRLGSANKRDIFVACRERFPYWTTPAQFDWRLLWLHSLGCLEKTGGLYVITPEGSGALQRYSPSYATLRADSRSFKEDPGAISSSTAQAQSDDEVPQQPETSEIENEDSPSVVVFLDEASRLAERLKTGALDSADSVGFERIIADAFNYLGFQAEHKSGPGDTDVLVTASLGQETYRSIVDGKSSRHGKVSNQQIDWLALERHRLNYRAEHILVVGPSFSSGDLLDNASKTGAALLSADDLAAVVRIHAATPLSLADLRELFRYAGHPEIPLQRIQEKAAEVARLQRLLPDIVTSFERSYGLGLLDPISADNLHHVLAHTYGRAIYAKDEIAAAMDLLCAPLIGALRKVTESSYALQMPLTSVGRRFQAQARQLLGQEDGPQQLTEDRSKIKLN